MKLNLLTKSIINFTESLNTFFRIIMLTSDCKGFNFFQLLLDRPFLFCFSHLKSLFISFQCYDWLGSSMYVSVPDRFCYDKTWIIFVLIFSFQSGLTDWLTERTFDAFEYYVWSHFPKRFFFNRFEAPLPKMNSSWNFWTLFWFLIS
jgi:hypothetical protein